MLRYVKWKGKPVGLLYPQHISMEQMSPIETLAYNTLAKAGFEFEDRNFTIFWRDRHIREVSIGKARRFQASYVIILLLEAGERKFTGTKYVGIHGDLNEMLRRFFGTSGEERKVIEVKW